MILIFISASEASWGWVAREFLQWALGVAEETRNATESGFL